MVFRRTPLPIFVMAAVVTAVGMLALPAGAIHLFPLAPGDPGGDCGAALQADPGGSAARVRVMGFQFDDDATQTSTSEVKAGESVTWHWDLPHCHSVTFESDQVGGTDGKEPGGFDGSEPQLVKPDGGKNTFTATFAVPGTYEYSCVHHGSVGMVGMVVVN